MEGSATIANMLKIRLQRVGRKAEPTFRLVLTDSKNGTKSGKYLETLGNYDSRRGEGSTFKADRISYWMSKGAKASTTVHNLLINKKITTGKKLNALPLKRTIVKETVVVEAPKDLTTDEAVEVKEEVKAEEATEVETPAEETVVEEAPAPAEEKTEEPAA